MKQPSKIEVYHLSDYLADKISHAARAGSIKLEDLDIDLQSKVSKNNGGGYDDHDLRVAINNLQLQKVGKDTLTGYFNKTTDKISPNMLDKSTQDWIMNELSFNPDKFRKADQPIDEKDLSQNLINKFTDYGDKIKVLQDNAAMKTDTVSFNTRFDRIESNITNINKIVADNASAITANKNDITSINNQLLTINSTLAGLDSKYTSMFVQKPIQETDLPASIMSAVSAVTTINAEIPTLKDRITKSTFSFSDGYVALTKDRLDSFERKKSTPIFDFVNKKKLEFNSDTGTYTEVDGYDGTNPGFILCKHTNKLYYNDVCVSKMTQELIRANDTFTPGETKTYDVTGLLDVSVGHYVSILAKQDPTIKGGNDYMDVSSYFTIKFNEQNFMVTNESSETVTVKVSLTDSRD